MQLETAKAFGLTPAQWRAQGADDRARMVAHELMRATREAFVAERIKEQMKKEGDAKPPGSTGVNAYEAQRAAMRNRLKRNG
jgi:hypothetical protein